ncbi:MAG: head GIN domain-containing protein [Parasphingopyxis sp.]|uniref:head GIN domain-containing protein n=1 Tax=Parasphingopyxis sp. TaxID=1920299 RepID=UPI003F9F4FEC
MRTLLISIFALALAACDGVIEINGDGLTNGQTLSELELAEFDSVSLRGPDNVEIVLGDTFDIRVEGDSDVTDRVRFEIRRDTLRIGRESSSGLSINDEPATIYITMPVINGASVLGSGDMQVARAESDAFELSIAGSGSLSIAELVADRAEFDIAGSGDVTAAGTVRNLEIGIAGSGDVEAEDLEVERAEIDIAGSGNVEITASGRVEGNLIGSGDVRVRGDAECSANSIGSGEMRCG